MNKKKDNIPGKDDGIKPSGKTGNVLKNMHAAADSASAGSNGSNKPVDKRRRMSRKVICPKDIALFQGVDVRTAQRKLQEVREALGKSRRAIVTIKQFCKQEAMTKDEIKEFMDQIYGVPDGNKEDDATS